MKSFLFLAVLGAAASLTGCTSTCDTADTAGCKTDTSGGAAPLLQNVGGTCDGSSCNWMVESDGIIGSAEVFLSETGDPSRTCGPDKSLNECGFWEEHHDALSYSGDSTYGGDVFSIDLTLVASFKDQVNNSSTIFDVNSATISNQLTVEFVITDSSGAYADCAVYGQDPSYFDCPNVW